MTTKAESIGVEGTNVKIYIASSPSFLG